MPFAGRKRHGDCRFGGTIANRTCLCRGAACRSRHNAADTNRLPLKWYAPIASVRFFGSRYGTAVPSRDCTPRALPRASRSGRHVGLRPPRNDNLGAITVLSSTCTSRPCSAGSGMPLPYNAWPAAWQNFPLSISNYPFSTRAFPSAAIPPQIKRRPRRGCSGAADCQKTCPAENFGGKKSVKGNRQGFLSRSITRRSGRIVK